MEKWVDIKGYEGIYNERHASDTGLKPRGSKSHLALLDEFQVLTIRSCVLDGIKQTLLAKYFKVSIPTISAIVKRGNWAHI